MAPNGVRTMETRLHLNRVVRKEATLAVDFVSGRKGPRIHPAHPTAVTASLHRGGILLGHWSTSGEAECAVPVLW